MATSTNKAKNFFEQRKKATPTKDVVEIAAKTSPPIPSNLDSNVIPDQNPALLSAPTQIDTVPKQEKASREKISNQVVTVPIPPDLKNFIETINYNNKINVNLPIEIDNKLQLALLQIKSKYALNNRQMNKTVLLSYIIDKALQENDFFE
jgi:hypothetical protein